MSQSWSLPESLLRDPRRKRGRCLRPNVNKGLRGQAGAQEKVMGEEGLEGGFNVVGHVGESVSVPPRQGFCLLPLLSPKCSEKGKGVTENLALRC